MSDKAFEAWKDSIELNTLRYYVEKPSFYALKAWQASRERFKEECLKCETKHDEECTRLIRKTKEQTVKQVIEALENPKTWLIASQDDILLYQKDIIEEVRKILNIEEDK